MKRFRVPDYDVKIRPHELLIINTPTFQRLFRLYQLGLAYTVYPFATYTRAAHAIETLNYAQQITDSIKDYHINDEKVNRIRMSALLHDIAHVPFSHTLEDENIVFKRKHDKKERLEIILNRLKNEIITPKRKRLSLLEPEGGTRESALMLIDQVKEVLWTISYGDKKDKASAGISFLDPEEWFIADIVGNTISADLLAYIKRDVETTGIEKRHGGYRIFDYLEIKEDEDKRKRLAIGLTKAGFRIDVFSAILDVLDIRYALMERVVFHHAKCSASAMLARAARLLDLEETENLYEIGDEIFLHNLLKTAEGDSISPQNKDAARHLIERLNSRTFYKRIYRVTRGEMVEYDKSHEPDFCGRFRDPIHCTDFENQIENEFRLPRGSILIFCPEKDMNLKEAKVMVDWAKGCVYPLNHQKFKDEYPKFWERVDQIEEKYKELWAFYVFIEPDEFGKSALIQQYLYESLGVKSDPLLDLYLQEKPQYQLSKNFAQIAARTSNEIKSNALDGLLQEAAWDGRSENWEEACKIALDGAMTTQLKQTTSAVPEAKREIAPRKDELFGETKRLAEKGDSESTKAEDKFPLLKKK
jgi:HD superfamily phosphohydrolase